MKKRIILVGVLLVAVIGASVPLGISMSDRHLLSKSEDAMYEEAKEYSTDRLIRRINRLEKKFPDITDKNKLLPLYTALIERSNEFSEEQLVNLIEKKETLSGIDEAFVTMYSTEGYNTSKMMELMDDPEISDHTKEYITAHCNFSVEELSEIFRSNDGKSATIAIKRITAIDSNTAMKLIQEFVNSDSGSISEEKYVSICLGIASYYEENQSPEDIEAMKSIYIPMIKKIFEDGNSTHVKDQAIYALGRICDYDLFMWLIENEKIDKALKISVIERNYRPMKRWVEAAKSENDIRAILEAMQIHPILEIADALEEAINQGNLQKTDEMISLIDYIRKNGINAVDKYEN